MFRFVFLKIFVTFLISGLPYSNVIHFFCVLCQCMVFWSVYLFFLWLLSFYYCDWISVLFSDLYDGIHFLMFMIS
jgi:hypothetical protein